MQFLKDDPKYTDLIKFVVAHKGKHRGILADFAKQSGKSDTHIQKLSIGNVPHTISNIRLLRTLANLLQELEEEVIQLTTVDAPMRA